MEPRLLFDSPDLRLLHVPSEGEDGPLIVTFSPLVHKDFDPPIGFGQDFFAKRGLAALHFISGVPHWWQRPAIVQAVEAAQAITRRHDQVVTYGSSMGGYGALIHSKALGATKVIAAAPQFSIDPAKAPFEHRWPHHASKLSFEWDDMENGISASAIKYVIFDPLSIDRMHVKLLPPANIEPVALPFCGHAPLAYLRKLESLSLTVLSMIDGSFDAAALKGKVRANRRGNWGYWLEMAKHRYNNQRFAAAIEILNHAKAMAPDPIAIRIKLAQALARAGNLTAAVEEIDEAARRRPNHRAAVKIRKDMLDSALRSQSGPGELHALHQRYSSIIDTDENLSALFTRLASQLNPNGQ